MDLKPKEKWEQSVEGYFGTRQVGERESEIVVGRWQTNVLKSTHQAIYFQRSNGKNN
jgi:hypothetical protein